MPSRLRVARIEMDAPLRQLRRRSARSSAECRSVRQHGAGAADPHDLAAEEIGCAAAWFGHAHAIEETRAAAQQACADDDRLDVAENGGIAVPGPCERGERRSFRETAGELNAPGRKRRHAGVGAGLDAANGNGELQSRIARPARCCRRSSRRRRRRPSLRPHGR